MDDSYSVYIHIPFCKSKCIYCDFASTVQKEIPFDDYTTCIINEYHSRIEQTQHSFSASSIYFGGGTPSILPAKYIIEMTSAISKTSDAEITVEVNPGDANKDWFKALIDAGVNRFSVGVQSLDDNRLSWLSRRHTSKDALRAIEMLDSLGCSNITADLIYGTPTQTEHDLRRELELFCKLPLSHISAYELTVTEGTPLANQFEDNRTASYLRDLWDTTRNVLETYNFDCYEVSNYAKPNFKSRHNSHYWKGSYYLGLGAGASGFVNVNDKLVRYTNAPKPHTYLTSPLPGQKISLGNHFEETITQIDLANEIIMLGLRHKNGINIPSLKTLIPYKQHYFDMLQELEEQGFLRLLNNYYVPTYEAMAMADELALNFF